MLNSMISLTSPFFYHSNVVSLPFSLLWIGCDALVYLAAYFIFGKKMKDFIGFHVSPGIIVTITSASIIVNLVLGWLFLGFKRDDSVAGLFNYIWNLIACILLLFLLFQVFTESKKDHDLIMMKELIASKKEEYNNDKKNIEMVNRKCHDMKYVIRAMMEKNSHIDEETMNETLKSIEVFDRSIKTGNEVLDTILSKYTLLEKENNVNIVSMIDGKLLSFMKPVDTYVIMGNLLDNAFRAIRKLPSEASHDLYLKLYKKNHFIILSTENCYQGNIDFKKGLPSTTKKDKEKHGIGLTSVRMLVKNYQGTMTIHAEDQVFRVEILFPENNHS